MIDEQITEKESRPLPLWLLGGGVGMGALIALLAVLSFMPSQKEAEKSRSKEEVADNSGETALASLANQQDLENARAFLGANAPKIVLLQKEVKDGSATLNQAFFAKTLSPNQVEEITQLGPTKLDGHHLISSLFWREVANRITGSLDLWSSLKKDPDRKAAMATFAWVCRMVAFSGSGSEAPDGLPIDPQLTLRKGWGSALDRALIFLALRNQQKASTEPGTPPDLLLQMETGQPGKTRILVGSWIPSAKDWWILDPVLGLPLEDADPAWGWLGKIPLETGPMGLKPLKWADMEWDLRPEWWNKLDISLVSTLSTLSPRMKSTEKILSQSGLGVTLYNDAEALVTVADKELVRLGKSGWKVGVWKPGIALLQAFVSPLEGGTDTNEQRTRFQQLGAVAWDALPPLLRIDLQLGANQSVTSRTQWLVSFTPWTAGLLNPVPLPVAEKVGEMFGSPFLASSYGPGKTKDLFLRGKWTRLTTDLVGEWDDLKKNQRSYDANRDAVDKGLAEWAQKAEGLYANLSRIQKRGSPTEVSAINGAVESLWKNAGPVYSVVTYALGRSRGTEIAFILAQIRQEEAQRLARLGGDPERLAMAWEESASAWRRFNEEMANGLAAPVGISSWAEALALGGQKAKAMAVLENPPKAIAPILRLPLLLKARVLSRGPV